VQPRNRTLPTDLAGVSGGRGSARPRPDLGSIDRALLAATHAGLPLVARPFADLALRLGLSEMDVMERFQRMLDTGVVRRIAAVPNHYALGYRANGMSVWDVADEAVAEAGAEVGALPFVSHCYHRVRRAPEWPYSLYAMVHARSRSEVAAGVARIAAVLGRRQRGHEVLFSTRILKKTGVRLTA